MWIELTYACVHWRPLARVVLELQGLLSGDKASCQIITFSWSTARFLWRTKIIYTCFMGVYAFSTVYSKELFFCTSTVASA
jgi:hypothetical protein